MNKLSKIFLVIIIVLVLALCIMSYLYVNMRKSSKQNLDSLLTKSEELTNAYQRIDELENKINTISNAIK
jgi:peptidoglycan hydrolase CwlO-like protein